jgi:PAS domain S-box-containing protein
LRTLQNAQPESVIALAIKVFPDFVKSKEYKRYRDEEKSRSENVSVHSQGIPGGQSIIDTALASVDVKEIDRLLQSGSWLTSLLASVENLPVCVSLSTARKDRPGFPLIYVNACFEFTTGYPRSEIVGQNCRFLQADKAEAESITRLSNALRDAKPVKVAITNFRKDGTPFKNLLAMKPIFDEAGVYRYVVGVQFDVTQEDATPMKLKLADELIRMLPNTIYSAANE